MGIEKEWGRKLCDINLGRKIAFDPAEEAHFAHSPNQKAQLVALTLATAIENDDYRRLDLALRNTNFFFDRQLKAGHMCMRHPNQIQDGRNPPNEMLISGAHYNIWVLACATILRYSNHEEAHDVRPKAEAWWDNEFRLYRLFSDPSGRVVCPATRWEEVNNTTPAYSRDALWRHQARLPQIGEAEKNRWWRLSDPQQAGVTWMRNMIEDGTYSLLGIDIEDPSLILPFTDEIRIHKAESWHYAWAPNGIRAMKPVPAVYTNYDTGEIEYTGKATEWDPSEDVVIRTV